MSCDLPENKNATETIVYKVAQVSSTVTRTSASETSEREKNVVSMKYILAIF